MPRDTAAPDGRRPSSTRNTTRHVPALPDPGAAGDLAEAPPRLTASGRAAAERSHVRRAEAEAEERRRQAEAEERRRQAEAEGGEEEGAEEDGDACIVEVPVWRPARLCDTIDTWGDKIVAPWPVCAGCSELEDEKGSKGLRYALPRDFRVSCIGLLGLYDLVKVWDAEAKTAYYSLWVGIPAQQAESLDVLRVTYTGMIRGGILTASIRKRAAAYPGRLDLRAEVYDLRPFTAPYEHNGRTQKVLMPMLHRLPDRAPAWLRNDELRRALELARADCEAWLGTFTAGRR